MLLFFFSRSSRFIWILMSLNNYAVDVLLVHDNNLWCVDLIMVGCVVSSSERKGIQSIYGVETIIHNQKKKCFTLKINHVRFARSNGYEKCRWEWARMIYPLCFTVSFLHIQKDHCLDHRHTRYVDNSLDNFSYDLLQLRGNFYQWPLQLMSIC